MMESSPVMEVMVVVRTPVMMPMPVMAMVLQVVMPAVMMQMVFAVMVQNTTPMRLAPVMQQVLVVSMRLAHMALVMQMRPMLMSMSLVLQVIMTPVLVMFVVPQVPQMALMLQVPFVLEVIALVMMAPLVVRLLVMVAMRPMALCFVRMALMGDVAVRLAPPINNAMHKPPPLLGVHDLSKPSHDVTHEVPAILSQVRRVEPLDLFGNPVEFRRYGVLVGLLGCSFEFLEQSIGIVKGVGHANPLDVQAGLKDRESEARGSTRQSPLNLHVRGSNRQVLDHVSRGGNRREGIGRAIVGTKVHAIVRPQNSESHRRGCARNRGDLNLKVHGRQVAETVRRGCAIRGTCSRSHNSVCSHVVSDQKR